MSAPDRLRHPSGATRGRARTGGPPYLYTVQVTEFALDAYVVEVLMRDLVGHDKSPSSFLVYLYLWAQTRGRGEETVALSHQSISEATGLSKSAVQSAVRNLARRKLIRSRKSTATSTPEYSVGRPWRSRS